MSFLGGVIYISSKITILQEYFTTPWKAQDDTGTTDDSDIGDI